MELKIEVNDYWALKEICWGDDAIFEQIEREHLTEDFFEFIKNKYMTGDMPYISVVNDFIHNEFEISMLK
jgi:hypothetical protein